MDMSRRSTTQDISWFLDLRRNEQLDLDPPYQRRSVWTFKDRKFFLDTVFRGYPSPAIYLHKVMEDGKTIYHVVDGKQRLETIFRFINNLIAIDNNYGDNRLNGKKWKNIENTPELARAFWDYVIPVEFINVAGGSEFVNEVFDRLNRNSRKLVEQELRHAKYDGWFATFVEREADEPDWKDLKVVTAARARRMKDTQFLSELLMVVISNDVIGFDQEIIDKYYADYNDPSDSDIEFDDVELGTRFIQARRYLVELEKHDNVITKYADDFKNLYTLWCLIVLKENTLPDISIFAGTYSNFMEEVNSIKSDDVVSKYMAGEITAQFPTSYKYYQNSIGANTDELQRKQRLEALAAIL